MRLAAFGEERKLLTRMLQGNILRTSCLCFRKCTTDLENLVYGSPAEGRCVFCSLMIRVTELADQHALCRSASQFSVHSRCLCALSMTAAPQRRGGNVSFRCCTPQTLLRALFGGMYAVPQRPRRCGKVQRSRQGDERATPVWCGSVVYECYNCVACLYAC